MPQGFFGKAISTTCQTKLTTSQKTVTLSGPGLSNSDCEREIVLISYLFVSKDIVIVQCCFIREMSSATATQKRKHGTLVRIALNASSCLILFHCREIRVCDVGHQCLFCTDSAHGPP